MKKFLVFIFILLVLLHTGQGDREFTLLHYFSGEYYSYTDVRIDNDSIDLGFCYMNTRFTQDNIVGESIKVKDFEVSNAIDILGAEVMKVEYLDDGLIVIYAYTHNIDEYVKIENSKVNLQIAYREEYSIIGWPLILGSF